MSLIAETVKKHEALKNLKLEQIVCVYSGKVGACCCGCKGTYRYASAHRELGGQWRGYALTNNDIKDSTVTLIFNKFKNSELKDFAMNTFGKETIFSAVIENRFYMIRIPAVTLK
jgi:hypothetical protein